MAISKYGHKANIQSCNLAAHFLTRRNPAFKGLIQSQSETLRDPQTEPGQATNSKSR